MDTNRFKAEILTRLCGNTGEILEKLIMENNDICRYISEIRVRAGMPLCIKVKNENIFLSVTGRQAPLREGYRPHSSEVNILLQRICQNSIYVYSEDIKNGFVTLPGGHRVGIAGKLLPSGSITDISGLNIRIAGEVKGCADKIIRHIIRNKRDVYNTLVISPPMCGKTTIIRDIARILSTGRKDPEFESINVGIIDERSEIAACYNGCPANDVGSLTDVYTGFPKAKGIDMMIRTMSPSVIITDEIGTKEDHMAIQSCMHAGVRIIATAHGYSLKEIEIRNGIKEMINDRLFEKYITLSSREGPGTIEDIFSTV